jgi:hypothetical protein
MMIIPSQRRLMADGCFLKPLIFYWIFSAGVIIDHCSVGEKYVTQHD